MRHTVLFYSMLFTLTLTAEVATEIFVDMYVRVREL